MNRLVINTIVRATRANPSIRTIAPYRWVCHLYSLTSPFNNFMQYIFSNPPKRMLLIKQDKVQI